MGFTIPRFLTARVLEMIDLSPVAGLEQSHYHELAADNSLFDISPHW